MTPKTKLIVSVGLAVVGFALVKWEDHKNAKAAAKNDDILKQQAEQLEALEKTTAETNDMLDRKIENAKFWLIVTEDEN
ncbi:hypothetical protein [Streptomyces phage Psst4]|uniref:Uncharacterized protein n=2 Tax=Rimavirus rima TaxID=2560784 RepID=A0A1I9SDR5_9CAUD|nr:hypothetical protein FDH06_gp38 [Streptomyces phage Rima]AOZ64992.1 hypothetical protein SEA_RIMA_38 [Streptomyces phage Rima]QAY16336.1 hypothetical protein SEA_NAMO_38 [Streptomyces phage Namo]WPJ30778.1 hypothetical protein [Streptomyces phage Psst4]